MHWSGQNFKGHMHEWNSFMSDFCIDPVFFSCISCPKNITKYLITCTHWHFVIGHFPVVPKLSDSLPPVSEETLRNTVPFHTVGWTSNFFQFSGPNKKVDLIKPVSNVCLCVHPTIHPSKKVSLISVKFGEFGHFQQLSPPPFTKGAGS